MQIRIGRMYEIKLEQTNTTHTVKVTAYAQDGFWRCEPEQCLSDMAEGSQPLKPIMVHEAEFIKEERK